MTNTRSRSRINAINSRRAKGFGTLLQSYDPSSIHYSRRLVKLLADARHWCDYCEECFGDLDRDAHSLYTAQLAGERRLA